MKDLVYDGKWSDRYEWKHSSQSELETLRVQLRTAHQEEFIYVMIDVLEDTTFDKKLDQSIICFDTENNKSKIADVDDYCFTAILDSSDGYTLQGGSPIATEDYFRKISNPDGFIAVGNISDENDRYTKIPHVSYEFRIPLELIGRADNYGFFVYVFDANTHTVSTYPELINMEDSKNIPSPSQWGDLISPDKSLPEFGFPMVLFSIGIISTIVLLAFKNPLRYQIKI